MKTSMVRARCRVDFAGGTLDLWPLGLLHPGSLTVNAALELSVEVQLEPASVGWEFLGPKEKATFQDLAEAVRHPSYGLLATVAQFERLPPARLMWRSESPRGAGLGASSALVVAALAAAELSRSGVLERSVLDRSRIARDLEAQVLRLPTGIQDHLAASVGGVLAIHHKPGGELVEPLDTDLEGLSRCLLVAYSGESHLSAATNWQVVRARLDGCSTLEKAFEELAAASGEARSALLSRDWEKLACAVGRDWAARARFAPGVLTPRLEALFQAAEELGAWGWKACGAGGGGSALVLAPPERLASIREVWTSMGAQPLLRATLTSSGLEFEVA